MEGNSLIHLITCISFYIRGFVYKTFASAGSYRYVDNRDISDITSNDSAEVRIEWIKR